MANSPVEPMSRPFSIAALAKKAGLDGFILGLLVMVFLAWLWPEGGENNSPLKLDEISSYGVSLIFFFYGLRLNLENLKAGLSKWRVHLTVHSTTFILFPVLVLVARPDFRLAAQSSPLAQRTLRLLVVHSLEQWFH